MAIDVRLYCAANEGMLGMARRQATRRQGGRIGIGEDWEQYVCSQMLAKLTRVAMTIDRTRARASLRQMDG
jgi:hypothetical protein